MRCVVQLVSYPITMRNTTPHILDLKLSPDAGEGTFSILYYHNSVTNDEKESIANHHVPSFSPITIIIAITITVTLISYSPPSYLLYES